MDPMLAALVAAAVLAAPGWLMLWWRERQHQQEKSHYLVERDETMRNLAEAHDRLYAAFKDGYVIPPASVEPPEPPAPLPPELRDFIGQFESPTTRDKWERIIRQKQETGMGTVAILRDLEEPQL